MVGFFLGVQPKVDETGQKNRVPTYSDLQLLEDPGLVFAPPGPVSSGGETAKRETWGLVIRRLKLLELNRKFDSLFAAGGFMLSVAFWLVWWWFPFRPTLPMIPSF